VTEEAEDAARVYKYTMSKQCRSPPTFPLEVLNGLDLAAADRKNIPPKHPEG
jgi:hypothetical protein